MSRLVCRDLRLQWPGGFEAGPLTLELGPGVHHLRGPNGSGKSTLLRCLCGAHRRSTGAIELPHGDPRTDVAARRDVALLSAEPELPAYLTVDEAWSELAAVRGAPEWNGTAVRERLGRETAEDDAMHGADAGARQDRHREFGNHGHVNANSISFFSTIIF